MSGFNRTLNVKKKASSTGWAEEARKTRRWWQGQAKAIASSGVLQYHHAAANAAVPANRNVET
jgi:hypothetical protein